jgi:hypothetical protein
MDSLICRRGRRLPILQTSGDCRDERLSRIFGAFLNSPAVPEREWQFNTTPEILAIFKPDDQMVLPGNQPRSFDEPPADRRCA